MNCEQASPLLSAYVDREIDLAASLDLERHVQECRTCADTLERHQDLRAVMAAVPAFTPPAGLEYRIRAQVRQRAGGSTRRAVAWWRWSAVPVAAAAAAILSWSVAVRQGTNAEAPLLTELVSGHVRSLMVDHLVDVASSDQHTVKPWFNGKLDFAPQVADFTAEGFPLAGGRVDYIAGRQVAVLVYKRRQHLINVFLWPAEKSEPGKDAAPTINGYHLRRWTTGNLTYWAVSDVNASDLETLAQLFGRSG